MWLPYTRRGSKCFPRHGRIMGWNLPVSSCSCLGMTNIFRLYVPVFRGWTRYLMNLTWGYNADALLKAWTLAAPWQIILQSQIREKQICLFWEKLFLFLLPLTLPTPSLCRLLIQAGYDVNIKDYDGWTPLHAASHWGKEEACRILVENLCDMDLINKMVSYWNCHESCH